MRVEPGTLWEGSATSTGIPRFRVLSVSKIEGQDWVHYREEKSAFAKPDCKEFSCYLESFVHRFKPVIE